MNKKDHTAPRDSERDFKLREMFFSTTDPHGTILVGNPVFVRVSGYAQADLVGSPHNIIRHPDMPRAVFRLFWAELKAGRPIVAYVKNMAADGSYYWVVALACPVEGGYLSVRFKPSTPLLSEVSGLYAKMREAEKSLENQQDGGKAGMDAAAALLVDALRARGFNDYAAFMRHLLATEFARREKHLEKEGGNPPSRSAVSQDKAEDLVTHLIRTMHEDGLVLNEQFKRLCGRLSEFSDMDERLIAKSEFVKDLGKEFGTISINAALESTKLGYEGASLEVIARYLGDASGQIGRVVAGLTRRIREALELLHSVSFHLFAGRLQVEMAVEFCRETLSENVAGSDADFSDRAASLCRMVGDLECAFSRSSSSAVEGLNALAKDVGELGQLSQLLHRTLTALNVAHISGMVEANRLKDEGGFAGMFGEVRSQIERTQKELADLDDVVGRLGNLSREAPGLSNAVQTAIRRMDADLKRLDVGGAKPAQPAPKAQPVAASA